jgi:hypothetical protein
MKKRIDIESLRKYYGELLNDKQFLEFKIDKDQKFISRMHCNLGTEQFLFYKEEITRNQKELKEVTEKITNAKTRIQNYEAQ